MKRLIFLIGMLVTCISFYGVPVKYLGCSPEDGGSISKFEFVLLFDISDAVADLEEGEWGLGYQGTSSARFTKLYEGTKETGTELATTMTSNFTGKSEGWSVGNDKITISFPEGLIPKENQLYTLVINNNFVIFPKDKAVSKSVTALKYEETPLILTFYGAKASGDDLTLQSVSIEEGASIEAIKDSRYTFNASISVNPDAKALIKEGDIVLAEATTMTVDNGNTLVANFGDEIPLSLGHSYTVYLPDGVAALVSDATKTNNAFSVNVKGAKTYTYAVASTSPSEGEKCLPVKASIAYEIPSGTKISGAQGQAIDKSLKIYKSDISEENLIASFTNGTWNSANTGFEWDLSGISFEPSTEYVLYREQGVGYLFDTNNNRLPEWTNEETVIHFFTPSIEEAGYSPMEFGTPVLADGTEVTDGQILASVSQLDIAPPNLRYEYDGIKYGFFDDRKNVKGFLYDITDSSPVLVKEFDVRVKTKETATEYYNALSLNINSVLYEGHEYRIEIPEGAFTIGNTRLYEYVRTAPFSINVKGSTPTEIKLLSTSVEDGAECSSLGDVVFKFNGELSLDREATALLRSYFTSGELARTEYLPMTSYVYNRETYLTAHAAVRTTGIPKTLSKGYRYELALPAGCLYVESMPEIANKETTLTIKGVEAPPVVTEPEYVTLKVSYMTPVGSGSAGEYDSADYTTAYSVYNTEFVKGKSISLAFDTNIWEVKHLVRFNGNATKGTDLYEFAENGTYTSSALNDNARFEIVLDYKGDIVFSNTTGVAELDKLDLRVFSDGDNIMVEGVEGGEQITVYSPTGIVIGTHEAAGQYDTVAIYAPKGQTYIVRIQRGTQTQAAKIMH